MENKKNNKKIFIIIAVVVLAVLLSIGIYLVMNNQTSSNVNAPELVQGMTPVKWNGSQWVETTTDDKEWYNYSKKQWANVRLADGSMFVWIPRYAYKITSGYNEKLENGRNNRHTIFARNYK